VRDGESLVEMVAQAKGQETGRATGETWYRVSLPGSTFGVMAKHGVVREAPPITRWMIGRSLAEVTTWVKKKYGAIVQDDDAAGTDTNTYVNEGTNR